MNHDSSRHVALQAAMNLWDAGAKIDPSRHIIQDDEDFFNQTAKENNLLIRRIYCNFDTLKKLNLPAILSFSHPDVATPIYLSLIKINEQKIMLNGEEEENFIELHPDDLNPYWLGKAYILWKNFIPLKGMVPLYYTEENIIAVKMLMQDIGFSEIKITPIYDIETRKAVEKIQRKYGIQVDGIVGPTTKIALYCEKRFDRMPRITK
jgi:general secretion pathway protein A